MSIMKKRKAKSTRRIRRLQKPGRLSPNLLVSLSYSETGDTRRELYWDISRHNANEPSNPRSAKRPEDVLELLQFASSLASWYGRCPDIEQPLCDKLAQFGQFLEECQDAWDWRQAEMAQDYGEDLSEFSF